MYEDNLWHHNSFFNVFQIRRNLEARYLKNKGQIINFYNSQPFDLLKMKIEQDNLFKQGVVYQFFEVIDSFCQKLRFELVRTYADICKVFGD